MISPQVGRAAFRVAFMMVALAGVMLLILTPGTAEYIISVITLVLGLVFMGIIFVLVRVMEQ
ncbi:MAG: hypothetical protein JW934_06470 [Anaerolineae bacterium]|nr:hypothetical protein [Anaerolineae bacterium]